MSAPENILQSYADGKLLLINKPYKWTSFDVVGKLRNAFKPLKLKVGHAGTLDPLATGLLIVCTGKMTKQIDTFQAEEKEYTGTMVLGATTPSYDMETEIDQTFDINCINSKDIQAATQNFLGDIIQYPPAHSAIKIDGERLYEKARRGEDVELRPRNINISEFEITDINLPEVSFRVVCSKGTYIRSLVHDFGKALNNGAYLSKLRRTRSGSFKIEDAHEIMELVRDIKGLKETYSNVGLQGANSPQPNPPRGGGHQPQEVTSNYRETADLKNYGLLKDFSRFNRHIPTEAENILWQLLRNDALDYKIRRQHIIDTYIVDFVCLQKGLVIEVDGKYHHAIKEDDAIRTKILNDWGFEVLRLNNEQVINSPSEVFKLIKHKITNMPDRQTPPLPGNISEEHSNKVNVSPSLPGRVGVGLSTQNDKGSPHQ